MRAADIQPGMAIKRQGYEDFKTVKSVRDLEEITPASRLFRNKIKLEFTDGGIIWIYKDELVTLRAAEPQDVRDIEVNEPTQI